MVYNMVRLHRYGLTKEDNTCYHVGFPPANPGIQTFTVIASQYTLPFTTVSVTTVYDVFSIN